MSPRVLIPLNDSETAQNTISAVIANKDLMPHDIILLHVVDVHLVHRLVPDIQKEMVYGASEKAGKRILDRLAEPFLQAGFEPKLLLELGTPAETIIRIVEQQDIQTVILGRHPGSGGFRDILFGSVANTVIRKVKCPVLLF